MLRKQNYKDRTLHAQKNAILIDGLAEVYLPSFGIGTILVKSAFTFAITIPQNHPLT